MKITKQKSQIRAIANQLGIVNTTDSFCIERGSAAIRNTAEVLPNSSSLRQKEKPEPATVKNSALTTESSVQLPDEVIALCGPYYGQMHTVVERLGRYVTIQRNSYRANVHITCVDVPVSEGCQGAKVRKEAA